jgi:hypothetical protein
MSSPVIFDINLSGGDFAPEMQPSKRGMRDALLDRFAIRPPRANEDP